jgi:hypothetical protein
MGYRRTFELLRKTMLFNSEGETAAALKGLRVVITQFLLGGELQHIDR